jgi:hypothetical protein
MRILGLQQVRAPCELCQRSSVSYNQNITDWRACGVCLIDIVARRRALARAIMLLAKVRGRPGISEAIRRGMLDE